MTARCTWLALGLFTAAGSACAGELAPASLAADRTGDAHDAVYFHPDRPLFLRLRLRLDDRAYQSAWRQAVEDLFRYFDSDANGALSAEEMNHGRWLDRLRNEAPSPPRHRDADNTAPFPTIHSPDELAEIIRPMLGPLTLQSAGKSADGAETLFARLDRNGDHALSQLELESADATLNVFDKDDDGLIRPSELLGFGERFTRMGTELGPAEPASAPFLLIDPHACHARLAHRLIQTYDRGSPGNPREPDHKLALSEIGIDAAPFRNADADSDGTLDTEELSRFLDHPAADLEVAVNIGSATVETLTTVSASTPEHASDFLDRRFCSRSPGLVDLRDDRVAVELSSRHIFTRSEPELRLAFEAIFAQLDVDGSQTLDRHEADPFGLFHDDFDLMDRDRDGKLTADEGKALMNQAFDLAHRRVLVVVADEGRSLFDALDTNHDRRLGPRELRCAAQRLPDWDRNRDGRLTEQEIPQQIRVAFDHAEISLSLQLGSNSLEEEPNPASAGGTRPGWFAKMDVNHDGDISAREFLAAPDVFRRLDRDGDGLLDPREAAHAEKPARHR